jgi:hypothetical protein
MNLAYELSSVADKMFISPVLLENEMILILLSVAPELINLYYLSFYIFFNEKTMPSWAFILPFYDLNYCKIYKFP